METVGQCASACLVLIPGTQLTGLTRCGVSRASLEWEKSQGMLAPEKKPQKQGTAVLMELK